MRKRTLGVAGTSVLLMSLGLTRLVGASGQPVTEDEAVAFVGRLAAAAIARDFDALCGMNGAAGNCYRTLDQFDLRASAPTERPTVVGTRRVNERTGETAGVVVAVTGATSCDAPYRTDVFVFRDDESALKAVNAVFWSNGRLAEGEPTSTSPTSTAPPVCP